MLYSSTESSTLTHTKEILLFSAIRTHKKRTHIDTEKISTAKHHTNPTQAGKIRKKERNRIAKIRKWNECE